MKDFKRLIYIILFSMILLLILVLFAFIRVNSTNEELVENILPMTLYGRIVDKTINYKNHSSKTIIIRVLDSSNIPLCDSDWCLIYESSEIGDSIYKNSGSLSLYIVDKNRNEKEIKYNPSSLYFHKRKWGRDF